MSEFTLVPEVVDEAHNDREPDNAEKEPGTLALSIDEFSSLEDRVLRAVNLVKRERLARSAAEERVTQTEARLNEQMAAAEQLQKEVDALRAERDQVRQRVERLLSQLDTLEL
jgi:chromosome segregation ATPase